MPKLHCLGDNINGIANSKISQQLVISKPQNSIQPSSAIFFFKFFQKVPEYLIFCKILKNMRKIWNEIWVENRGKSQRPFTQSCLPKWPFLKIKCYSNFRDLYQMKQFERDDLCQ